MAIDEAVSLLKLAAQSVYCFDSLHDVAIEIIEAEVVSYASESLFHRLECPRDGCEFNEVFRNEPHIGVPLGCSDSNATGTLGGYVRLSTASDVKYMALTCYHVLTSKSPSDPLMAAPTNNMVQEAKLRSGRIVSRRSPSHALLSLR